MAGSDCKRLRSGFTTGTAAAAAVRAALELIFSGRTPEKVTVALLTGDDLTIAVHQCRGIDSHSAVCSVIKDAGDDPDITHGAEICARVKWRKTHGDPEVIVRGGQGVGMVTKPGLEVPPGRHAINPGPLKMIRRAALDAMAEHGRQGTAEVEIFVPRGRKLARKTLNARLGIVGGISILGTTGIVRPMSHEAYTATIRSALSVARAVGLHRVVLTTGRRSERFARNQWPQLSEEAFVQIGDYFAQSMEMAATQGFEAVTLAVFFGKAVKMANGIAHTHAGSARMSLKQLSRWAMRITGDSHLADRVDKANTARHAFEMLKDDYPEVIDKVGREVVRKAELFGGGGVKVGAVIFGFDGTVRFALRMNL
ncbi:MAG: cobalt-precorrin-5B (C(1))-methyltransferase CbiD [Desulfobacteraceae bacterium]|jgi:cobalt-precorrin-5B (C1)-methyltransferase